MPSDLAAWGPKRGSAAGGSGRRSQGCRSRLLWPPQVPLERSFGSWRIGSLYVLSGIFGTMVSVVFLPEVLSVGASASVFGLVGTPTALAPSPNPNPNPISKPNPSHKPESQPQQ